MRISMWILKKELEDYEPESVILDGRLILRTVRFLTDGTENAEDVVYVGTTESWDTSGDLYNQVICASSQDLLLLKADDAAEIHNRLMDIFDKYNQWEEKIHRALLQNHSLQMFLDVAAEHLGGPVCLVDTGFYIHARSDIGGDQVNVSVFIDDAGKLMKINAVRAINRSGYMIWKNRRSAYKAPIVFPNIYGALRNLYQGEEHEGWLSYLRADRQVVQAELDLMDILGDLIEQWFERNRQRNEMHGKASVFLEILNAAELDEEAVKRRIQRLGISADSRYMVYAFRSIARDAVPINAFKRNLDLLFHVAILWQEKYVLLIHACNEGQIYPVEMALTSLLKNVGWVCGCSKEFLGVQQMKLQVQLALFSSQYATEECCVKHFESVAVKYCLEKLSSMECIGICHPALYELEEYDRKRGTDLFITLQNYLACERNLVRTAKQMNVHRNSIVYRIERILDMTKLDLDDFDTRLYLQISYVLFDRHA